VQRVIRELFIIIHLLSFFILIQISRNIIKIKGCNTIKNQIIENITFSYDKIYERKIEYA
jgi:hypothetical protein